jgi:transcriptional regulator with XRE-family HTH domain
MKMEDVILTLLEEKGLSRRQFCLMIGLPPTSFASMLRHGIGKTSIDIVLKITRGLGVTVRQLELMAEHDTTDLSLIAALEQEKEPSREELYGMVAKKIGRLRKLSDEEIDRMEIAIKIALGKDDDNGDI